MTSAWPTAERPAYGVMIARQVESLAGRGIRSDVLFIEGYRSPLAYVLAAARLLVASARPRRYRLVHAHGGEAGLAARFQFRAPLVVSFMGSDVLGAPGPDGRLSPSRRLRRWIARRSALFARATVTKSEGMAAVLPARAQSRNSVIPNGVDRTLFAPLERNEARARLGWDSADRIALFAADPTLPYKRFDLAERAVRRASETVGRLRLEVAHGIEPGRMPLLMNAADCLLHPSASEGSPNVVKEALACNLPVVATPVGDVPELLDGVTPSYLAGAAADELAAALVQCLSEPGRSNGREKSEGLAAERVAARLIDLYDQVAPRPGESAAEGP